MLEEPVIFSRQHSLQQDRRYVLVFRRGSLFLAELGHEPPIAAIDGQRDLQADVAQLLGLGQRRHHIVVAAREKAAQCHGPDQAVDP